MALVCLVARIDLELQVVRRRDGQAAEELRAAIPAPLYSFDAFRVVDEQPLVARIRP